jgi:hypothetical protein
MEPSLHHRSLSGDFRMSNNNAGSAALALNAPFQAAKGPLQWLRERMAQRHQRKLERQFADTMVALGQADAFAALQQVGRTLD